MHLSLLPFQLLEWLDNCHYLRFQSQNFLTSIFLNCLKCDIPVGEIDVVGCCRRKWKEMKRRISFLREKKIITMLQFSKLKVMNTLEVFWLASLLITGDIYFDNYRVERVFFFFFKWTFCNSCIYLSYYLCMYLAIVWACLGQVYWQLQSICQQLKKHSF